jgi:PII-like signaling protein
MGLSGRAKRVRIYLSESVKIGHQAAHLALLQLLRHERAHGATVVRAFEGFGAAGQVHVSHLIDVAADLPIVLEWIDAPEEVERLLPRIEGLLPKGMITVDDTEIVVRKP